MAVFDGVVPAIIGAAGAAAGDYQIDRSLRFNSADSAYLNRTPSSAGSDTTVTFSCWVKRSSTGTQIIFSTRTDDQNRAHIGFNSLNQLAVVSRVSNSKTLELNTEAVYRDFSAWYHVCAVVDTTNSTAGDRCRLYVNGSRITDFAVETYTNGTTIFGATSQKIGVLDYSSNLYYLDGYLADVHFIDGQALAPTDFGGFDADNNWNPKAYSGSYGTNGFKLDFSDNSSVAALGNDSSGNNNDWTANNFSVGETTVSYWRQATSSDNPSNAVGTVTYRTQRALENPQTSALVFDHQNTNVIGLQNITGVTSLRLRISSRGGAKVGVNTGAMVSIGNLGGDYSNANDANSVWYTWSNPPSTITSIAAYGGGSGTGNFSSVWAIEVNGVRLEDSVASECDSLIDTPTNYEADSGNNGGNYATWNPLKPTNGAHSEGNLKFVGNSNWCHSPGTFLLSSGKWYFEGTYKGGSYGSGSGNIASGIGFIRADATLGEGANQEPANSADFRNNTLAFYQNGYFTNLSTYSSVRTQISEGDVVGVSINFDAGTYAFYVNNSSVASGSLSYTGPFLPWTHVYYNNSFYDCNFGQRPFAYTPPTGFLPLVTTNLTDPTIADGSTAMDATLYDGNGGTAQTISGINHSPDFVWYKHRSAASSHGLFDIVRGANNYLSSNSTSAEQTVSGVTAFNSDGFSLGTDTGANGSGTWAAWTWDAGTTTATNNNGSIQSTVRANQSAGFSIVKYGGKSGGGSWGHGLNAPPDFIIFKRYTAAQNWFVWLRESDGTYLEFEGLNNDRAAYSTRNNVSATGTTVTLTTAAEFNSDPSSNYLAYCFSSVSQYSSFGIYTGNGSSDGPFVYTGFRPKFILFKNSDQVVNWRIIDTARSTVNVMDDYLSPNTSDAEIASSVNQLDVLSNGFKLRGTSGGTNGSGNTMIYAAFAEHPFKTARAR